VKKRVEQLFKKQFLMGGGGGHKISTHNMNPFQPPIKELETILHINLPPFEAKGSLF